MFKKAPIFLWIIMLSLATVTFSCNKHDDDDDWGDGNGGGGGIWNPTIIDGKLPGLFSISPTQQVQFSQGNLQYQASTNTWRFAEHQWDYVGSQKPVYYGEEIDTGSPLYLDKIGGTVIGSDNSEISPTYSGWIDLFGWGTSGWDCGNTYYRPWDTATIFSEYGPPGKNDLTDSYAHSDWGVHNTISNGGNQQNYWRTLTLEEWEYLFETRVTPSGIRFAKAKVNDVGGIILLPDDWNASTYSLNNTNIGSHEAYFDGNTITASQWTKLENAGAIFLPAAGSRLGTIVTPFGPLKDLASIPCCGYYWSTSHASNAEASGLFFLEGGLRKHISNHFSCGPRCYGLSVRLVCSVQGTNNNTEIHVTTCMPSEITQTSARCGGEVGVSQGQTLTELGICWSTSQNPTINDSRLSTTDWNEPFICTVTNLQSNTIYHVRAYALHEFECHYGEDKTFTTLAEPVEPVDYTSNYVGNYLGQFTLAITSLNNNQVSDISFPIESFSIDIAEGTTPNTITATVTIDNESHQTFGVVTEEKVVFNPFHFVIDKPDFMFDLDFVMEGTKAESNILNIIGTFSGNGSANILGYDQFFNEVSGAINGELMKQ